MSTPLTETLASGRFQLLEVLGEGGMATVYRAFDRRLQRYRAIKILSPALAQRESLRKRFLSEAQTMATLEESRVVRIFDMGDDDGRVYIVMELVEGGSLVDRVNGAGPLPPQLATSVALQIAESLHAAHQAGVIHRDIKPHNILLTRTGEIRITDFGIAQVQSEEKDGMTRTGAVMGTWGFMAPEQRSNAKGVDARADVFSLGATLWALLKADTPPELYAEDDAYADIPEALVDVIRKACSYRREDRFGSAQAFADGLREVLTALPPDPEFVPPLVLPKEVRTLAALESATLDPDADPPAPGTMVPDATPDPSLALLRKTPVPTPPVIVPPPVPGAVVTTAPTVNNPPLMGTGAPRPRGAPWFLIGAGVVMVLLISVGTVSWRLSRPDPAVEPPSPPVAAVEAPPIAPPIVAPVEPPPVDPPAGDGAALASPSIPTATPVPAKPDVTKPGKPDYTKPETTKPAVVKPEATTTEATAAAVVTPKPAGTPSDTSDVQLSHYPPGSASLGGSVTLTATGGVDWTVLVFYRSAEGSAYAKKVMNASGSSFTATIKLTDEFSTGMQYFLQATTPTGTVKSGGASTPYTVTVK